ncbi:MAG: hypothetical protein JNM20_17220 [Rhizobiales bacterium]|nr:hypothetical protein [Hyphomicrobiales bacterium]
MCQKPKARREWYEEELFNALRFLAQDPAVLDDILQKIRAALAELKELESLKKCTPASQRTPDWESEHKKQMKDCSKTLNALAKRWDNVLNPPFDESSTRH